MEFIFKVLLALGLTAAFAWIVSEFIKLLMHGASLAMG